MNWSDITDAVGQTAKVAGQALGGPAGGAVGGMIASALGVEESPEAVSKELKNNPEARAKLEKLEKQHTQEMRRMVLAAETNRLESINKTMRAEAQASDGYVRRWRPTFGYLCALAWAAQSGAVAWIIVSSPSEAATAVEAVSALTPMWGIALSILGINVSARSRDKRVAAGQDGRGMAERLVDKVKGG